MEIYKSLNSTEEDPPGERKFSLALRRAFVVVVG